MNSNEYIDRDHTQRAIVVDVMNPSYRMCVIVRERERQVTPLEEDDVYGYEYVYRTLNRSKGPRHGRRFPPSLGIPMSLTAFVP